MMYFPAIRIGRTKNPMNSNPTNKFEVKGKSILEYYAKHRRDQLDITHILNPGSNTLEEQVNFQLKNLTGYKLNIRTIGSNHCVKYETRSGKYILPHHVGTGVNFITSNTTTFLNFL